MLLCLVCRLYSYVCLNAKHMNAIFDGGKLGIKTKTREEKTTAEASCNNKIKTKNGTKVQIFR